MESVARPVFEKGAKIYCEKCQSHLFSFAAPVYYGEFMGVPLLLLDREAGQAPWHLDEPKNCRKCGVSWSWLIEN